MTQLEKRRSRYLRDPMPVRLGGLAANLARVASFSNHDGHREAVTTTLQESKWFIEWIATELETSACAELVGLQIQLAIWERQSDRHWQNDDWRSNLAFHARQWSERVLEMSGLRTS